MGDLVSHVGNFMGFGGKAAEAAVPSNTLKKVKSEESLDNIHLNHDLEKDQTKHEEHQEEIDHEQEEKEQSMQLKFGANNQDAVHEHDPHAAKDEIETSILQLRSKVTGHKETLKAMNS